jgi:hypothetical protein
MTITVQWDNAEKSIVRYIYEGPWTLNDFNTAYLQARELMDTVDHKVHLIIDVTKSGLLPSNVLARSQSVARRHHPNEGSVVIVGASTFIRSLLEIYQRVYSDLVAPGKFHTAPNLEEARRLLHDAVNN